MAALDLDEAGLACSSRRSPRQPGCSRSAAELDEAWLPTTAYDGWLGQDVAERWADLVEAWLATTRGPRAGRRARTTAAARCRCLGPDAGPLASRRGCAGRLLDELAAAPPARPRAPSRSWPGCAGGAPPRRPAARRPGRPRRCTRRRRSAWSAAARWALPARLLGGDADAAVRSLTALLPEPLDHVLLQADLTAVAPGPLAERPRGRGCGWLADVESTGGATVYRFSDASVRRALDAGWSATDLLSLLEGHSRTPGAAAAELSRRGRGPPARADPGGRGLVVPALRRRGAARRDRGGPPVGGAAAAPAGADGARRAGTARRGARTPAGRGLRAGRRGRPRATSSCTAPTPAARRYDVRPPGWSAPPPARHRRCSTQPCGPSAPVTVRSPPIKRPRRPRSCRRLDAGAADGDRRHPGPARGRRCGPASSLWIGYVNAEGHATQRVVEPISVEGGYVKAYDHLRDEVRTFAIHRITGVSHDRRNRLVTFERFDRTAGG